MDKPDGSIIEESIDAEGITLSWPTPTLGSSRYFSAAFIAFWLCGWALGWIATVISLIQKGPRLFLIVWLGGWTIGGGWAIWCLYNLLRRPRPESVRLEAERLRYEPGRTAVNVFKQRGWSQRMFRQFQVRLSWRGRKSAISYWNVLGSASGCVSTVAPLDRLEIGACLREPEREWLHEVLQQWLASSTSKVAGPSPSYH